VSNVRSSYQSNAAITVPGETPDEEDRPPEEPCEEPVWVEEPPEPDRCGRCGSDGVRCANRAKTKAETAAATRPIRQVIFLTRRRPSSLARRAAVCCERVTRSGLCFVPLKLRTDFFRTSKESR
jgi:hypothetical protein